MSLGGEGTARCRTRYGVSALLLHCEASQEISGQALLHPLAGIYLEVG